MIVSLSQPYASRHEAPVIDRVDDIIFRATYFTHCMQCGFCKDQCCSYGADVDAENLARIGEVADELEAFTGLAREQWFEKPLAMDADFPGGLHTRTRAVDGACVFLDRQNRGCKIHAFAMSRGMDFNRIKPIVCTLFPVTFTEGLLCASDEVHDKTLVCLGEGPSLYEGAREGLLHYFGAGLVAELDTLSARARQAA